MIVERLKLKNFRRFESLDISCARHLNVFVGINGAGKSTILMAISKMLSWYVRRLLSPNGTGQGMPIHEQEVKNGSSSSNITLSVDCIINNCKIEWNLQKSTRGAPITSTRSDLKQLNDYIKDFRGQGAIRSLPVIVSYSVNRAVLDIPLRIKQHHQFSILSVYDDAFEISADFRLFFEWFRESEDIENERLADSLSNGKSIASCQCRELSAVRHVLSVFLPEFKSWKIRRSPLRLEVLNVEGVSLNIEQLSDGEKNIIALVGDLARRLVVANPDASNPLDGNGIVMIDEIELHLHPAWQKNILPRLLKTFPNVQFIVTTHSPLLLAQLNTLLYERQNSDITVYGIKDGILSSMLDPETGLIVSGEMDDVAQSIDEEFVAILDKEK